MRQLTDTDRQHLDSLDRNAMRPFQDRATPVHVEGCIPSSSIRHIVRSADAREKRWEWLARVWRALRPQQGNGTATGRKWSLKRATLAAAREERYVVEDCPHGVPSWSNCLSCFRSRAQGYCCEHAGIDGHCPIHNWVDED